MEFETDATEEPAPQLEKPQKKSLLSSFESLLGGTTSIIRKSNNLFDTFQ